MQHDHVLKKLNFDLMTPHAGSGGGGGLQENICYHDDALVIPCNLICKKTMFLRS